MPAAPIEHRARAADTVDASCGARTEEDRRRSDDLKATWANIQAGFFGVGGLIHVAVGLAGGMGAFLTKRSGVCRERLVEGELAGDWAREGGGMHGVDLSVVHLVRGHKTDPAMVMLLVVPVEEGAAETYGVLNTAEAFRKARLILQRLEDGVDGPNGISVP